MSEQARGPGRPRKVQEYALAKGTDLTRMVKKVNQMMADGWSPVGGPVQQGRSYAQAMVK